MACHFAGLCLLYLLAPACPLSLCTVSPGSVSASICLQNESLPALTVQRLRLQAGARRYIRHSRTWLLLR